MAITAADIKRVASEETDFGFEMQVGEVLAEQRQILQANKRGCIDQLLHGGTYTDSVEGKPRQFDYRCRLSWRVAEGFMACVCLAIECKKLDLSCPLVISGRPRTAEEAYYCFVHSKNQSTNAVGRTIRVSTGHFYRVPDFVGKASFRVREKNRAKGDEQRKEKKKEESPAKLQPVLTADGDEDIYKKWSQALASAVDLASQARVSAFPTERVWCSLILPVVVVPDNTLWKLQYAYNGAIESDPTLEDECEYFVGRRMLTDWEFVVSHVHFVTMKGLRLLLSRIWMRSDVWSSYFPVSGPH